MGRSRQNDLRGGKGEMGKLPASNLLLETLLLSGKKKEAGLYRPGKETFLLRFSKTGGRGPGL